MDVMRFVIRENFATALVISDKTIWNEDVREKIRAQKGEGEEWDVMFLGKDVLVYAVTQTSARKIIYEHGIRNFDKAFDEALREWCRGETKHVGERPRCVDGGEIFCRYNESTIDVEQWKY
jgi:hypothetical protein